MSRDSKLLFQSSLGNWNDKLDVLLAAKNNELDA